MDKCYCINARVDTSNFKASTIRGDSTSRSRCRDEFLNTMTCLLSMLSIDFTIDKQSKHNYVNTVLSMLHFIYAMVYLMNIIEDFTRTRWTRYFRLIVWGYKWDITTQSHQYLPFLYIWLSTLNKCSWIISNNIQTTNICCMKWWIGIIRNLF